MIERITDPRINLTDKDTTDPDGLPLAALTNIGMGTVFEELLRKFNEENNEEAGETVIDPNKPVMVHAGDNDDEPLDPLDVILKEFNERWFKGWDAAPDDQKAKMIGVAKAVSEDEDYQTLVVGNPDKEAVDEAMIAIIDRIMRQQRKGDMSLYKEYQKNEGFKYNFRNVISRLLGDLAYIK